LIRTLKRTGEEVTLSLWRDGKPLELLVPLSREEDRERLVAGHSFDQAPNYLIKGGMVFQELTVPLMEAFGEDWQSRVPLNLMNALEQSGDYEKSVDRVVILSGSIPTPATVGYERLRHMIVSQVNGKPIRHLQALVDAFRTMDSTAIHSIQFAEDPLTIYLSEKVAGDVDRQLLSRGIHRLSRVSAK
jgi:hypothetical protein